MEIERLSCVFRSPVIAWAACIAKNRHTTPVHLSPYQFSDSRWLKQGLVLRCLAQEDTANYPLAVLSVSPLIRLSQRASTSFLSSKAVIRSHRASSSELTRIAFWTFKASYCIMASLEIPVIWKGQELHEQPGTSLWPAWCRATDSRQALSQVRACVYTPRCWKCSP